MKTFVFILFFSALAFGDGSSYSFLINFYPRKIQVSSPHEIPKNVSVIIKNNSLNNIWGKIIDEDKNEIDHVGIPSQGIRTVLLKNYQKDKNYYFISQSPPFQNIVLTFNKNNYEIPPSR